MEGFLTVEDYGKALFADEEAYSDSDSDYDRSVPLGLVSRIMDMREGFERTYVRVRGVYSHPCSSPEPSYSAISWAPEEI